jgi:hypothetical protein
MNAGSGSGQSGSQNGLLRSRNVIDVTQKIPPTEWENFTIKAVIGERSSMESERGISIYRTERRFHVGVHISYGTLPQRK